jgi:hypothetical protein
MKKKQTFFYYFPRMGAIPAVFQEFIRVFRMDRKEKKAGVHEFGRRRG